MFTTVAVAPTLVAINEQEKKMDMQMNRSEKMDDCLFSQVTNAKTAEIETTGKEAESQGYNPPCTLSMVMDGIHRDGLALGDVEANIMRKIEFGRRLRFIWEKKLYKRQFHSFNVFISREFSFTIQQAMNYINASKVFDRLLEAGQQRAMPCTLKQCIQVYKDNNRTGRSYQDIWQGMVDDGELVCSISSERQGMF